VLIDHLDVEQLAMKHLRHLMFILDSLPKRYE